MTKGYIYNPKFCVTDNRLQKESSTYPSFAASDLQRPCFLNTLSGTSAAAAAVGHVKFAAILWNFMNTISYTVC